MKVLDIRLLGTLEVAIVDETDGTSRSLPIPPGRRPAALLACLALAASELSRADIAESIWRDESRVNDVAQALKTLKDAWAAEGAGEWIDTPRRGCLGLLADRGHRTATDLAALYEAIADERDDEVLELVSGPLCPGLDDIPCVERERKRLAQELRAPFARLQQKAYGNEAALHRIAHARSLVEDGERAALDRRTIAAVRPAASRAPAAPDRARVRRPRWRLAAAASIVVAGLLSLLIVALTGSGGSRREVSAGQPCPRALWEPDPADAAAATAVARHGDHPLLGRRVAVDMRPTATVAGREGIWVTGSAGVALIDRRGHVAGTPIDVGGRAFAVALTRDRMWVTRRDGRLVEVDRASRRVLGPPIKYGAGAAEVTTGFGAIWINGTAEDKDDPANGTLIRIDPCTRDSRTATVGRIANTVRAGFGSLWLTDSEDDEVRRVDPHTMKVRSIGTGELADPQDIAIARDYVWVTDYYKKRVARIDPRTNRLDRLRLRISPEPGGAAIGAGALWTAGYAGGEVSRVDLAKLESRPDVVNAGDGPTDIAVGFGRLWVPLNNSTVVREIRP